MKTLKVLLQEVVSGIKAWVNSNFAQESNTVHKTGNETVNGNKTFSGRNTFSDHTYIYGQWKGLYFKNPEATAGTAPSGDIRSYISFTDSNDYVLGSIILNVTGANSTWLQTGISAKDVNDSSQSIYCGTQYRVYGNGEKYFVPATNGDIYFGTSTLQWKSVYAQSYYYNGTAWGLDKANVWTMYNTFTGDARPIRLRGSNNDIYNVQPQSPIYSQIDFVDKNNTTQSYIVFQHRADATETHRICFRVNRTQGDHYVSVNLNSNDELYPERNNAIDLGTSTNKWKTFNGLNPGALSLPEGSDSESIAVDITDWYIQDPDYPDDPTKKILDGTNHKVDTAVPGWLHINFPNVAGNWAYARKYAAGTNMALQRIADGNASSDFTNVALIFPIHSSCYVRIKAKTATVRIFPCLGNV